MPAAAALRAGHPVGARRTWSAPSGGGDRLSARAVGSRPATPAFCIRGEPCGVDYPVYSGEGAIVNVRRRGSATVLATLPIVEGHFKIRLGPGEYVFHPCLPEEQCWTGEPVD